MVTLSLSQPPFTELSSGRAHPSLEPPADPPLHLLPSQFLVFLSERLSPHRKCEWPEELFSVSLERGEKVHRPPCSGQESFEVCLPPSLLCRWSEDTFSEPDPGQSSQHSTRSSRAAASAQGLSRDTLKSQIDPWGLGLGEHLGGRLEPRQEVEQPLTLVCRDQSTSATSGTPGSEHPSNLLHLPEK